MNGTVTLQSGTWDITVEAKNNTVIVARAVLANVTVPVNSTVTIEKEVLLQPIPGGENGSLDWEILYDGGFDTLDSAVLYYSSSSDASSVREIDLTDTDFRGTLGDLGPGSWLFRVVLIQNGIQDGNAEVVHIYSGMTSVLSWTFTEDNFISGAEFVPPEAVSITYSYPPGTGIRYYVSMSNGNDASNGRSETAPFKTLTRVNSLNLGPGDQVLFKTGDIWFSADESSQTPLRPKGAGAAGNPIVIGAYGTGPRPIINGSGGTEAVDIRIKNITVRDLEIINDDSRGYNGNTALKGAQVRRGVYLFANSPAEASA